MQGMRDKYRTTSNVMAVKAREILVFAIIFNILCIQNIEIEMKWTRI
jgi:hypothetical protein